MLHISLCFFFNDTATTEIYTLSLHDALPIFLYDGIDRSGWIFQQLLKLNFHKISTCDNYLVIDADTLFVKDTVLDRKSTRLNSSHANISYAVFCLKKKK